MYLEINYLSFPCIVIFFSGIFSFIFLLLKKRINSLNLKWSLFSLATGLWGFGAFFLFTAPNADKALFWGRFINYLPFVLGILFFHILCIFSGLEQKKKKEIYLYYIVSIILATLSLLFYKQYVVSVQILFGGFYYPTPGILYKLETGLFAYLVCYGLVLLWKAMRGRKYPIKSNQAKYLFLGCLIGYSGGTMAFLPVYNILIPPIGIYLIPAYVLTTTIAIIKHGLMDINLAWRYFTKNAIYFLFLIGFSIATFISAFQYHNFVAFSIFAILIILIAYFKPHIDTFLNDLFLGKYKKIWDDLKLAAQIDKNIYETLTLSTILTFEIPKVLNLSYAAFYEISETGGNYNLLQTTTPSYYGKENKNKSLAFINPLVQELYRRKTYLYLETVKKDEHSKELVKIFNDLKINLCFPLFDEECKNLNAIIFYGKKDDNTLFHSEDLEILNNMMQEADRQLNNIHNVKNISNEVLQKYKNTYQIQLLEESKRLGEIRDLKYFNEHSIKLINRLLNASETEIYLHDEKKRIYIKQDNKNTINWDIKENIDEIADEIELTEVEEETSIEDTNYLAKYLSDTKEILLSSTLQDWSNQVKAKELTEAAQTAKSLNANIIIPMMDISHLLGFIVIKNKPKEIQPYSQDDYLMLAFISDKIQTTLCNIYANGLANLDEMTGLHNLRFLRHRLESEVARSLREGKPVSFVMIDIDDFKSYNDIGGHEEGDIVIREVSTALRTLIRPTDECFRYGGDEFSVILRDTNLDEATSVANRVKNKLSGLKTMKYLKGVFGDDVTLSFGISTFNPKEAKGDYAFPEVQGIMKILITRADDALYESKGEGKNRVSVTEEFEEVCYVEVEDQSIRDQKEEEKVEAARHLDYDPNELPKPRHEYEDDPDISDPDISDSDVSDSDVSDSDVSDSDVNKTCRKEDKETDKDDGDTD